MKSIDLDIIKGGVRRLAQEADFSLSADDAALPAAVNIQCHSHRVLGFEL